MKRITHVGLVLAVLLAFFGCSANPLAQWSAARDQMKRELVATTQQIAELEAQVAVLPDGPAKQEALAALTQAHELVPVFRAKIENLDNLIVAARAGDASNVGASLGNLLSGVPVVGPYAGLIGVLAGIAWGVYQRLERGRDVADAQRQAEEAKAHLKNVVKSLEQAGPEWTASEKAAIAAIQGPATSAAVERIKQGDCRLSAVG